MYLNISDLQNWGKNKSTTFHKWICKLTPEIRDILTLKRQEKLHLKMSSVYVACWIFLLTSQSYFFAYRQTVWTQIRLLLKQSDLGPHSLQKWLLKSQPEDKADNNFAIGALRVKNIVEKRRNYSFGEISKEQFLLFSTIFCYLLLDFHVKTGIRLSLWDKQLFDRSKVMIKRVDCTYLDIQTLQQYMSRIMRKELL